jgi:hypothetical protein
MPKVAKRHRHSHDYELDEGVATIDPCACGETIIATMLEEGWELEEDEDDA